MGKTALRVSDHAFARYAERVLGLDRSEVTAHLRRLIGATVRICPDCRVPFRVGAEEFVAVVENRTLVTILPKGAPEVGLRPHPNARFPKARRSERSLLDSPEP